MTGNKPKMRLEVEKQQKTKARRSPGMLKMISRFEAQDQKTSPIAKNKPCLNTEVGKIKQQAARPCHTQAAARKEETGGREQEEEDDRQATSKKKHSAPSEAIKHMNPNVPLQEMKVKMTSPPKSSIFEVKRESFSKKIPRFDSPKLLTRMKPLKRAKVETLLRLTKPEARNSPVKPRNFNLLLESWEQTSHVNLTSAVRNTPSLGPEADSQSEKILQNPQKIKPGISHPIGQKKFGRGLIGKFSQ